MGVPTIKTGPMTVEEFYAFTDTRPDNEKWELIDGQPILNVSPGRLHQTILWNLGFLLCDIQRRRPQIWESAPGIGVRVSDTSLPEPDVFAEHRIQSLADSLELPALGISLPLSEIYRDTGLK